MVCQLSYRAPQGFALILAEDRFPIDLEDEAELSRFVRNGILPLLDGSAAAILAPKSDGGGT
ncbi:hypothetical protein [Altererythrobacter sp. C41]|uniref:hypothetical protein n=1 Tax=Altererythrobacter sp. C41 TaxID=2806021 RepID=UPI001933BF81|nr:hypothetical protein [Altererythrobacter sp. C41]MBM0170143.1 hypothetical protein [Altererythrobacter sp. C41]